MPQIAVVEARAKTFPSLRLFIWCGLRGYLWPRWNVAGSYIGPCCGFQQRGLGPPGYEGRVKRRALAGSNAGALAGARGSAPE